MTSLYARMHRRPRAKSYQRFLTREAATGPGVDSASPRLLGLLAVSNRDYLTIPIPSTTDRSLLMASAKLPPGCRSIANRMGCARQLGDVSIPRRVLSSNTEIAPPLTLR